MCVDRQVAKFLINLLLSPGDGSNQTMNAGGSYETLVLMHAITRYCSPEECPVEVYMRVH